MKRLMLLLVAGMTPGCGGSAFESGAAHDGDAAPLEAGQDLDGGVAESSATDAAAESVSPPPRVAFCASYAFDDSGSPAVYGCGAGWLALADAGLTVPDAAYAVVDMRVNQAGDPYAGPSCLSSNGAPFDCLDPDAGGDGTCQVQLTPGDSFENIRNGRCFRSLNEALAGW